MNVELLSYTPEPERVVAISARLCYSKSNISDLKEKLSEADKKKLVEKIIKLGHYSVLEHASFTFGVEGVSRALTHQLVRHRIASYSQQSQRYVQFSEDTFAYVEPGTIKGNKTASEKFNTLVRNIYSAYREFLEMGIPQEDARYIFPNAAETKIIITMNARELLHFFQLRGCMRAQWEIRILAKKMLKSVKSVAPIVFSKAGPACVSGSCSEGEMTCGKPKEVREEFLNI